MPAGISHSVITPAALAPRGNLESGQKEPQPREAVAAVGGENPQTALSAGRDELIRAPDPAPGSQRPDNQMVAETTDKADSGGSEPTGAPAVPQTQAQMESGLGGQIDLTI